MKKMKRMMAGALLFAMLVSLCACFDSTIGGSFEVNRAEVYNFGASESRVDNYETYYTRYLVHYTNIETEDEEVDLDKYKNGIYVFVTARPEKGKTEIYLEARVTANAKIVEEYPLTVQDQGENYVLTVYDTPYFFSDKGFDVEKMKEQLTKRTIYVAKENVILYDNEH